MFTFGFSVVRIQLFGLSVEFLPLFIVILSILLILLDSELLSLLVVESQSFFESEWINFLQDSLQGNQTFLQDPRIRY